MFESIDNGAKAGSLKDRFAGSARKTIVLLSFGILFVTIGGIYAAVSVSTKMVKQPDATKTETPTATSTPRNGEPPREPLQTAITDLTLRGFEPNVIRRSQGQGLLVIYNNSLRPELNLQMKTANGTIFREFRIPRSKRKLAIPSDLPPGQYQVVDAERPDHVLRIDVME